MTWMFANGHMCGRNIVANTYNHGGMLMEATAKNVDRTARTAYEMAEAQRDSFEALAENIAAAPRRSTGDAVEVLREQAEHNAQTAEAFGRAVSRQQESFRTLTQGWVGAYTDFFSPFAYARQGMRAFQQATRQGLEATEQVARQVLRVAEETTKQGLRVAEDTAERTDKVLSQSEKATREAELRTAVFSALGTTDYEGLTVEEVSKRIEGLSNDQLKKVREFEKKNKNRETLIEQIDRKIRANS